MNIKPIQAAALAVSIIFAPQAAGAVSYSDISRLKSEDRDIRSDIDKLRKQVERLEKRAIRLTTDCDGGTCTISEAVTYDTFDLCERSVTPEISSRSTCVRLTDTEN